MDAQSRHRVQTMTRLTDYLVAANLRSPAIGRLAVACLDRAVLLLEVQDSILSSAFGMDANEICAVRNLRQRIAVDCVGESAIIGRHADITSQSQADLGTFSDYASHLKSAKPGWTYMQFCAAVPAPTGFQVAEALKDFFREKEKVAESQRRARRGMSHDPKSPLYSFSERSQASGMPELETAFQVSASTESNKSVGSRTESRGPPRKRLLQVLEQQRSQPNLTQGAPWQFSGHLIREAHMRTVAKSWTGSWESSASALMLWHMFSLAFNPYRPQFPVEENLLAAYATFIDNPGTLEQYLSKLNQAHKILQLKPISSGIKAAVCRGANKGAPKYSLKRCFLMSKVLTPIVQSLRRQGENSLADLLAVGYTYQLRAHSELFLICKDSRATSRLYSAIEISERTVTLVLSKRKNRQYESRIARGCWCKVCPEICGACVLRRIYHSDIAEHEKVFPQDKSRLTRVFKETAKSADCHNATWHGLRRGRTVDLLNLRDGSGRPAVSLAEIFESGQWAEGSGSLLAYIRQSDVDCSKLVTIFADQSESD